MKKPKTAIEEERDHIIKWTYDLNPKLNKKKQKRVLKRMNQTISKEHNALLMALEKVNKKRKKKRGK